MTLRRKTQLILGFTLLVMLLLLDMTFTSILRDSAKRLDQERLEQDISRAVVSIRGEAQTLSAIAGTWANSNATWQFMRGNNPTYARDMLNSEALVRLGISSMIFLDNNKYIKLFQNYNADDESGLPQSEFATIFMGENAMNESMLDNIPPNGLNGIVQNGDNPMLFSINPITAAGEQGRQAGYLVVTRPLGNKLVTEISRNIGFNFSIEPVAQEDRTENSGAPHFRITDSAEEDSGSKLGTGSYEGRMLVNDHFGMPSFYVVGITQKEDTSASERMLQYMFLIFAAAAIIVCIMWDFLFKSLFSRRMTKLQQEMEAIRDDPAVKGSVTAGKKKDEISKLAKTINDTLAYLNFYQERKRKSDEISLRVYEKYAQSGQALYMKTLEDVAVTFAPVDEKFRTAMGRSAKKTEEFCHFLGMHDEDCYNCYLGALYSRIGLLGTTDEFRVRGAEGTLPDREMREYKLYPARSKELLDSIEVLRPISQLPFTWCENYDGSGYPQGLFGEAIPIAGRVFAIVDAWNEMTRPWPGRAIPADLEVKNRLRDMAGKRLDPILTEEFIKLLDKEKEQDLIDLADLGKKTSK